MWRRTVLPNPPTNAQCLRKRLRPKPPPPSCPQRDRGWRTYLTELHPSSSVGVLA